MVEDRPAAHLRHVAQEVGEIAAIITTELVVGGLEPAAVRHVQRKLELAELLRRLRTDAGHGVGVGVLRERAGRLETGGIERELRTIEIWRAVDEAIDLPFPVPAQLARPFALPFRV